MEVIIIAIKLTTKETMLLKDEKAHEELCIQKYQNYANQTQDQELKQLFNTLAQKEQEHLNTVNQILNGQVPNIQQNAQSGQQMQQPQQSQSQPTAINQNDKTMCSDMLSTEKYVSSTYNTVIFESVDTNVRQVLNHIQKEEQEHGEQIFNYMRNKGMYTPQ